MRKTTRWRSGNTPPWSGPLVVRSSFSSGPRGWVTRQRITWLLLCFSVGQSGCDSWRLGLGLAHGPEGCAICASPSCGSKDPAPHLYTEPPGARTLDLSNRANVSTFPGNRGRNPPSDHAAAQHDGIPRPPSNCKRERRASILACSTTSRSSVPRPRTAKQMIWTARERLNRVVT